MNLHPLIDFVAGDDWEIVATLLDENGRPYDLTGSHTIKWRLIANSSGIAVIGDEAVITLPDAANGVCSVVIPSAITSPVVGGRYTDALRLVMSGETGTLLMGQVNVISDPWAFPEKQRLIERQKLKLIELKYESQVTAVRGMASGESSLIE
jgi:hypothetical protein